MGKKFASALALAATLLWGLAPAPASAQSTNAYLAWMCNTTNFGWCPVSNSNPLPITPVAGGTPQDVNIKQVGGTTTSVGNGSTDAGTLRVTVSNDSTGQIVAKGAAAAGAAVSGNPVLIGGSDGTNAQTVKTDASGNVGTVQFDTTASGNITTQNLNPNSGTATAGSTVALALNGTGTVTIQVTGTYTGALTPQVTTDGSNWVTQAGNTTLLNMANGGYSATIASASTGIWQIEVNGHAQFRLTALGAVTGTAVVSLRGAQGTSQVTVSNGLVGGYEFNTAVIPTVQNAAYAAGQSLGGLQTISIGSTNGLSGILTQITLGSKGGSTVGIVAYVWSKNPSNTTCTDKSNFVVSQTDNQYLIVSPQLITPSLAVSAQDTTTYGSASNLVGNFVNGSSNTNLYVCLLASASVTPATTTDLRLTIQGVKDQP